MRLRALLICSLLIGLGRSASKDSKYTCAHDGYSRSDGTCECTSNTYKGSTFNFYSDTKCNTIECTNSGVRIAALDDDEVETPNQRCSCPPGFLGTHCEPTHCVPGELQSFNEVSHARDVAVIITYNVEFQQQLANKDKNDNLPKTICDALKKQAGIDKDSKLTFWLMETQVTTRNATCEQDVNGALGMCEEVEVEESNGIKKKYRDCQGDLTTDYILDALQSMGEDSRLIILSNKGLQDADDSTARIEAIRKKTISLRTQIHSILMSPRQPLGNKIYFTDPQFTLLRDLSESTLGFFITPFDAAGGQLLGGDNGDGMSKILTKMMTVFFDYVVVDRITTNSTSCQQASDYTVFKTMETDSDPFWLTVSSNSPMFESYNTNWIGADVGNATVDAGFFKGYNLPATKGLRYTLKPVNFNNAGSKCVPTTILVLAQSQHLARFAITNDDAIDASSPYAISGTSNTNTLVGHFVDYFHEDHLKNLYLEFSNEDDFSADLKQQPLTRECQYNAKFSDVTCDEGKNTLIRVRNSVTGDAVTVQSLYCTEPETKTTVSLHNGFALRDSFAESAECDLSKLSPLNIEVVKDKRTLILAAHATDIIYQLFNGNSKSAIRYLNDLDDSGHYSKYVVNIFTAQDGTDAQDYDDYGAFKAHLMQRWNEDITVKDVHCTAEVDDHGTAKPMDAILPLVDILSPGTKTLANSDIIYIFDRSIKNTMGTDEQFADELKTLQRQMYQKRLRLIVLLLGCDNADFGDDGSSIKQWNDVATRTGGFMVHFPEPDKLNEFLASYVQWVKGETASSIDGKDWPGMTFSMDPVTSTPFQVQDGKNYTILVNTLPAVAQVVVNLDSGAETIDRDDLLGNSLSVFKYTATEDGVLSVTATPAMYFYYSTIRVLEVTDNDFATIGFTDATCLDSTYPDLNPKKLQYPVTNTVKEANVSMTIFTAKGEILRTGETRDLQSNSYPLDDYNWKCNDQNNVFYISADVVTEASTYTRVITTQCFGSGDPSDKCINGLYNTTSKNCDCPHDFTGEQCDRPVCQNGGTVTASQECDCTGTDYDGAFCERYTQCEAHAPFTPQYKSIATTIIFLVERSEFVVGRIKKIKDNTPPMENMFKEVRAAQYLVVEYGPVANYTVRISTTDKDLLYRELTTITAEPEPVDPPGTDPPSDPIFFDAIPAIKAALQAQTTDSAHLFWFAQDDSVDDFVSEVFEPIANNRVTISAFFGKYTLDTVAAPVHPVTLTGGSIFYSKEEGDYVELFNKYVIVLLTYELNFEHRPNTLSITTAATKEVTHTINIDLTVTQLFVAAYDSQTIELKKNNGDGTATAVSGLVTIPGGALYEIGTDKPTVNPALAAGEYSVIITNKDDMSNRTSSVLALTWNQVAYGFYRSDESDVFMDSAMMGDNVLVTYWLSEGSNYAPSAVITPLALEGAGEPVELYMTVRGKCSYTLSVPVNCTGEADAYGVKITNSIISKGGTNGEWKVDKYIPVLCLAAHFCHNGGKPTDSGCECTYFYEGLYCEIDKCTNGEKTDGKCVCNTGYSGEFCDTFTKPADRAGIAFLFIQDVCGSDEALKDAAQSVYVSYLALMKTTDKFYLATNAKGTIAQPISNADLQKALDANRAAVVDSCDPTLGDALDAFFDMLRKPNPAGSFAAEAASDPSVGKANVAYVTTVGTDDNKGESLQRLENDYIFNMEFIGITDKNVFFPNQEVFDDFPGEFLQTYDTEVALLDLVNTFGADTKPVIPSLDSIPRCIKDLQAAFAFHTDISSVPNMKDYRAKAQQVIASVTKYFSIPDKNIDIDDDTCVYNKDQMEKKTLFYGSIYANSSGIGVPTFCISNMDTYPKTITSADYKQAPQVTLQSVVDSYTKWFNSQQKMDCHCFDNKNPNTTSIIMWTPLSPTSLDPIGKVSFDGFKPGNFKHIVMPFGFSFKDSPLWNKLVPEENWITDASRPDYDVDQIIQDLWTIICRISGHIEFDQTAEPMNPYTTKKPRVGEDTWKDDDLLVTPDSPVAPR